MVVKILQHSRKRIVRCHSFEILVGVSNCILKLTVIVDNLQIEQFPARLVKVCLPRKKVFALYQTMETQCQSTLLYLCPSRFLQVSLFVLKYGPCYIAPSSQTLLTRPVHRRCIVEESVVWQMMSVACVGNVMELRLRLRWIDYISGDPGF